MSSRSHGHLPLWQWQQPKPEMPCLCILYGVSARSPQRYGDPMLVNAAARLRGRRNRELWCWQMETGSVRRPVPRVQGRSQGLQAAGVPVGREAGAQMESLERMHAWPGPRDPVRHRCLELVMQPHLSPQHPWLPGSIRCKLPSLLNALSRAPSPFAPVGSEGSKPGHDTGLAKTG